MKQGNRTKRRRNKEMTAFIRGFFVSLDDTIITTTQNRMKTLKLISAE